MPFSVVIDGNVHDVVWKKTHYGYVAYLKEEYICQCFKMSRNWSVVVSSDKCQKSCLIKVDGFKTRLDCLIYALHATNIYKS